MEENRKLKQKIVINELTQGMQLAHQLKNHLDPASQQTCEFLLEQILSSYDKAVEMLQVSALFPVVGMPDSSPCSLAGSTSPTSEDLNDQSNKQSRKKRKTIPSWSEQVCVGSERELESRLDDGYNWRKYGQKIILGSKFPRSYYRCTYKNSQGCLAIKQVQKSDEDPAIFQVTYRGRHTCVQASQSIPRLSSLEKEPQPSVNINNDCLPQEEEEEEIIQNQPEEMFSNIEEGLKSENEDLDKTQSIFPSFSFVFTATEPEENSFLGAFSSPFVSPATSECSYFSLLPCPFTNFEISQHLQSPESNLTEIMKDPTSLTNSPIGDLDFPLHQVDFDPNFPFDTSDIFT